MDIKFTHEGLKEIMKNISFFYKFENLLFDENGDTIKDLYNSRYPYSNMHLFFIFLIQKFPKFEVETLLNFGYDEKFIAVFDNIYNVTSLPKSVELIPNKIFRIIIGNKNFISLNEKINILTTVYYKMISLNNDIIIKDSSTEKYQVCFSLEDMKELFEAESQSKLIVNYLISFESIDNNYVNIDSLNSIESKLFLDFNEWLSNVANYRKDNYEKNVDEISDFNNRNSFSEIYG